jgi:hypothetical protein
MKEYVRVLTGLDQWLLDNPTLSHQRRALGTNGRMAEVSVVDDWWAKQIFNASFSFLERLHKEIFESLPQNQKEEITDELKQSIIPTDKDGKPALTPEYLKSIGREDLLSF